MNWDYNLNDEICTHLFNKPAVESTDVDITEGKCGLLLYGIPGTGNSALAKHLPDAVEQTRGSATASQRYVRVQAGNNGLTMINKIAQQCTFQPLGRYHFRCTPMFT